MKTFVFVVFSVESELVFRETPSALPLLEITGFEPGKELADYMIFADETFNIGQAWYCTENSSGRVYEVSPEYGSGPQFINSSLTLFMASIEAAAHWSTLHDSRAVRRNPQLIDLLAEALFKIDRQAFDSPENHWAMLIDHAKQCATEEDMDIGEYYFEFK